MEEEFHRRVDAKVDELGSDHPDVIEFHKYQSRWGVSNAKLLWMYNDLTDSERDRLSSIRSVAESKMHEFYNKYNLHRK